MKNITQTVTGAKLGDIFYTSWGYEQTNVDFYQIVKIVSNHFVLVQKLKQEIKYTQSMAGDTIGLKNDFLNDIQYRVKINVAKWDNEKKPRFKEPEYKHYDASLWNGKPKYTSSYY